MHRLHFLTQLVQHPSAANLATLVALAAVGIAACYLLSRLDVAVIIVVGMFLQMFSGNWALMGVPLPLDRLTLLVAMIVLALKGARWVSARRIVLRPLHLVLLVAAAWATASAIVAGTLFHSLGFFALTDRFGLVPLTFFFLAPLVFGSPKQRNVLLAGLVAIGLYLSVIAVLEGVHANSLIFPRYITDPSVGIQFGRARGPFLETTGNGFCIFSGTVAAALALGEWRSQWARVACWMVIALSAPALLFTLTRSVWIGAVLGTLGGMFFSKRLRRFVVPVIFAGVMVVGLALALVPALRNETINSVNREASIWDRDNMYLAALRVVETHPLTGAGWANFINVSTEYMRQQPGYPMVGFGLEVHNVFLSRAADLGLPGLFLWCLGLGGAMWRALSRKRPAPPLQRDELLTADELSPAWWEHWRPGCVAMILCFLVIANLVPFSEPLPNTLIWTWLGVLAIPYTSVARSPIRQSALASATGVGEVQPVSP